MSTTNSCDCQSDRMITIISNTLRKCVKFCSSIDEITIRNSIESAMDNLERAKIINCYSCNSIKVSGREIFSWRKKYLSNTRNVPGDLFCDSDGRIIGLIISTIDNEFCILRNDPNSTLITIDVNVSFENYIDHNIHIEEPRDQ